MDLGLGRPPGSVSHAQCHRCSVDTFMVVWKGAGVAVAQRGFIYRDSSCQVDPAGECQTLTYRFMVWRQGAVS